MEKKNKNQISTVLLIVGVIFIMIAGSIFVTTAWQHLSETGKQLILTLLVAGLYTASWKLREKGILTKTEHALYYLATAGTGFVTVSFLGGWETMNGYLYTTDAATTLNNADRALCGLFAAGAGIAYRFFKERKAWDFGILSSIFVIMFMLVFEASVHDIAGLVPLIGLTLLATFQYMTKGHTGYRVAQSIGLVFINFFLVSELFEIACNEAIVTRTSEIWWFFAALIINLALMVILKRKELVVVVIANNWFMTFVQVLAGLDDWGNEGSNNIVPFALCTTLSFLIMWYQENEDKYRRLAIVHGFMAAFELAVYIMAQTEWYSNIDWDILAIAAMCICVMIAFIFSIVDSVITSDTAKHIMKTCTLLFCEIGAFFLSIVVVPLDLFDFVVELASAFFGAGIYALGVIWKDRLNGISKVQFVLTCITLFILLMHNIRVEELSNLMMLGITGIAMLIIAAIKNRKEYVIASSVTLSLLAIYLTREFWLSIEWWVYLFAAGVVLVGIAIKKEKDV